jgi:hypothetical protein
MLLGFTTVAIFLAVNPDATTVPLGADLVHAWPDAVQTSSEAPASVLKIIFYENGNIVVRAQTRDGETWSAKVSRNLKRHNLISLP